MFLDDDGITFHLPVHRGDNSSHEWEKPHDTCGLNDEIGHSSYQNWNCLLPKQAVDIASHNRERPAHKVGLNQFQSCFILAVPLSSRRCSQKGDNHKQNS